MPKIVVFMYSSKFTTDPIAAQLIQKNQVSKQEIESSENQGLNHNDLGYKSYSGFSNLMT